VHGVGLYLRKKRVSRSPSSPLRLQESKVGGKSPDINKNEKEKNQERKKVRQKPKI
jgi:hypothetical protein